MPISSEGFALSFGRIWVRLRNFETFFIFPLAMGELKGYNTTENS